MAQTGARADRDCDHIGFRGAELLPVFLAGTGHHGPSADRDPARHLPRLSR